jgi:hypothetical protein
MVIRVLIHPRVLTVTGVPSRQVFDTVSFNILLCLLYELWEIGDRDTCDNSQKLILVNKSGEHTRRQ